MNSELVLSALDDVAAAFCVLRDEQTRRRARWLVQRLQKAVSAGEFAVEVEYYALLRGWVALSNSVEATENDREKLRGLLRKLRYYAKRRLERLPPQQRPVAQMLLTLADLLEENESRMLLVSATIKRRN